MRSLWLPLLAMAGVAMILVGVWRVLDTGEPSRPPPPPMPLGPIDDAPQELRDLLRRMPEMKPHEADEAVRALARRDPRTVPALIQVLATSMSTNEELQEAVAAITSVGPEALPEVLAFFLRSKGVTAKRAYTALRHLIPTAAQWKGGRTNPFARAWTPAHGDAAKPFESALLRRVRDDEDANARRYALLILAALPPRARTEASIPLLVDAFVRDDSVVRAEASYALMVSGTTARDAVPRLARLLDRDDEDLRDLTIAVLARLGQDEPSVAETLAQRLATESNPADQTSICVALAQMGAHARPALPHFERALLSGDEASGRTAVNCLVALEDLAFPLLLRALGHSDPLARGLAAQAFGLLGAATPPEAEEALRALARDGDPAVARKAGTALERIAAARKG